MSFRSSDLVKRRLTIASRRLGTANPVSMLGGVFDRSFALPVGDVRYGNNSLSPGSMPLEHSFSEVSPSSLRLDMELGGPDATPQARRDETSHTVRGLVHSQFGRDALHWFDRRSEPWRTGAIDGGARFGAFFGGAWDRNGLSEAKAYYEFRPGQIGDLPPNLQHAVRVAMAALPGLRPIFTSVAAGRRRGAQRVYLFYPDELRLLDLEPVMHQLGIGHQLPSVLSSLGVITGGRFTLPAGSAVMGLRDSERGVELKLDLLLPAMPDPPREMHGLIQLHLAQRPEAQRALRNWMQAMTLDDERSPGDMSVVGVKVDKRMPARLSIYFRPAESAPRADAPGSRRLVATGEDEYRSIGMM